jgi:hypothetical protein
VNKNNGREGRHNERVSSCCLTAARDATAAFEQGRYYTQDFSVPQKNVPPLSHRFGFLKIQNIFMDH